MLCVWKKEHDNQTLEKTLAHPYRICTGVVIAECSVFYDHGPGAQLIRKCCPGRQELLTIKNNVCCLSITPTKHSLLQIPPQEVAHLADGESGGPRVLVQEGVELVRLVLQGLGVGDLHGHPGDDAEAITESLVDNLCVDLERKILIGKKILFQKMTLLVVTNSSATGLYSALLLMST